MNGGATISSTLRRRPPSSARLRAAPAVGSVRTAATANQRTLTPPTQQPALGYGREARSSPTTNRRPPGGERQAEQPIRGGARRTTGKRGGRDIWQRSRMRRRLTGGRGDGQPMGGALSAAARFLNPRRQPLLAWPGGEGRAGGLRHGLRGGRGLRGRARGLGSAAEPPPALGEAFWGLGVPQSC